MFYSDFIVRGYDDANWQFIPLSDIYFYQLVIFLITFAIYLITWILFPKKTISSFWAAELRLGRRRVAAIALFSLTIIAIEIAKRLYYSDWSISNAIIYTFGSRFGKPWLSSEGALGDEKFIYALVGILLPLAAITAGSLVLTTRGLQRIALVFLYLISLALLFGDGSRTSVIFVISVPLLIFLYQRRTPTQKVFAFCFALALAGLSTSMMITNRDYGYLEDSRDYKLSLVYHQDDSYYRAIRAMYIADTTSERWDAPRFLLSATLNFIPRALWPGKPYVLGDFFGSYKEHYVTISFIGELVAMFGVGAGSGIAVVFAVILYRLLARIYTGITGVEQFILYFLMLLWIYMIMRNLLNITQWMYMFVLFYLFVNRRVIIKTFHRIVLFN